MGIKYTAVELHHTCKALPWLAAFVVAKITTSKTFRNRNCEFVQFIHLKQQIIAKVK